MNRRSASFSEELESLKTLSLYQGDERQFEKQYAVLKNQSQDSDTDLSTCQDKVSGQVHVNQSIEITSRNIGWLHFYLLATLAINNDSSPHIGLCKGIYI